MKKLIFITVMVLLVGCQPNPDVKVLADPDGRELIDYKPLNEIALKLGEAMENEDLEGLLNLMAEDATWNFPNGVSVQGKDQMGPLFTSVFDQFEKIQMDAGDSEPVLLGVKTKEGDRWLLRWTNYYMKNNAGKEFNISWHLATQFDESNKIKIMNTWYDRTDLVGQYEEGDIIK